jgi:hypothetical protein
VNDERAFSYAVAAPAPFVSDTQLVWILSMPAGETVGCNVPETSSSKAC